MKAAKIYQSDVEELACKLVGLDYDEIDADESIIEDALFQKYDIGIDTLTSILNDLTPLIEVGKSALTETVYKGYADKEKEMWLLKIEA